MLSGCKVNLDEEAEVTITDGTIQVIKSINVINSTPETDTTSVSIDTPISIQYAEVIESADLKLNISMQTNNTTVAGEYSVSGDTVSFYPANTLAENTQYTLTVSGSILEKPLQQSIINFTTAEAGVQYKPKIGFTESTPYADASAVQTNTPISIRYSETIESSDLNINFSLQADNKILSGSYDVSGDTINFYPDNLLAGNTKHLVSVTGNSNGRKLEAVNINFTTVPNTPEPISVLSQTPADLSNNVALTESITVTFSDNVDSSEVSINMEVLQNNNIVSGQTEITNDQLVFTPNAPFEAGTKIEVFLDESTDSQRLIDENKWSFTTLSNQDTVCSNFYSADFQLTKGFDNTRVSSISKPTKGITTTDPSYGTCVVRMTDHKNEAPNGFARAEYSRKQAFNANNTMLLALANDGFWHVYDANTGEYLKRLNGPASDADLRWDSSNPDIMYFTGTYGSLKIYELTVSTNAYQKIGDFTGRLPWSNAARAWTKAEGTSSADGRYLGLQVETEDHRGLGLMVWDKETDTIVGTWDFSENGVGRPDHTSMSPSGKYIVASWDGNDFGTTAFTRDFSKQVKLHHKSEHSDLALLPNGNDAYVAVDYQSNAGDVFMVEIQTGIRTVLFESYVKGSATAFHFSGKAYKKPGWVLVSTYGGTSSYDGSTIWMHDKIFAVELRSNPSILQLAHHHSKENGYWTEPHATVNQDFTRVAFNSNWEVDSSTDIDTYQIKLPENIIPDATSN